MDKTSYIISERYNNISLIDYLLFHNLGQKNIYKLFLQNNIYLNNYVAKKEMILKKLDILDIYYDEAIDFVEDYKKIDVLFEDDYLLIINKMGNIIVHPDDKNKTGTLCNIVAGYFKTHNINRNIRFAHRLDYETTGIIIFTKDLLTECYMNKIIEDHSLNRYYLAVADGYFKDKSGIISERIASDRHINGKKRVSKNGLEAITEYKVLKENKHHTLVQLKLMTGRTHQIRVHLAFLNNPVTGDKLYGVTTTKSNRVCLHSYQVVFNHPYSNAKIDLKVEMPSDMNWFFDEENSDVNC